MFKHLLLDRWFHRAVSYHRKFHFCLLLPLKYCKYVHSENILWRPTRPYVRSLAFHFPFNIISHISPNMKFVKIMHQYPTMLVFSYKPSVHGYIQLLYDTTSLKLQLHVFSTVPHYTHRANAQAERSTLPNSIIWIFHLPYYFSFVLCVYLQPLRNPHLCVCVVAFAFIMCAAGVCRVCFIILPKYIVRWWWRMKATTMDEFLVFCAWHVFLCRALPRKRVTCLFLFYI